MPIYAAKFVVPVSSPPIVDGAVAVSNGVIKAVGAKADVVRQFSDETLVELGSSAIVPGFVNCHTHLELTAFRGALDAFDHDFCKWLVEITRLRKEHAAQEEIDISAMLGVCEAAASGVTTLGDIGRIGSAGASALEKAGLRGIVFQETEFAPDDANAEKEFAALQDKFESLTKDRLKNVSMGISPHAPYTVSRKLFEKIARYAVNNEVPISIHAAESQAEADLMKTGGGIFAEVFFKESINWKAPQMSTIQYFSEIGVLDSAPLLAHCIDVNSGEIDLIARSGSKVAHCPVSNSKFGHGIAPLSEFIKSGVTIGLGSDSMASNNRCDMLHEAKIAGLFSRVLPAGPKFLGPRDLFSLVTLGGAKALGMDHLVGSLDAGKQADLVFISVDGVGQLPANDIYSVLVFSTGASSVETVMVDGEVVFEKGTMIRIDTDELKDRISRIF